MAAPQVVKIIPEQSVILICDLQTRFSELFECSCVGRARSEVILLVT